MLRRGGQGEYGRSALKPAGSSTSKLEVIVIDADQFTCRMRRRYSSCKRPSSGERPPALLMRLSLGSVQMGWRRLSWCGLAGLPRKGAVERIGSTAGDDFLFDLPLLAIRGWITNVNEDVVKTVSLAFYIEAH